MKTKRQDSFGIIGLGRFGLALTAELARAGKDVLCVDTNEEAVKEARLYTEHAFVAESYSLAALREIGMQNCDTVIVAIDGRLDTGILATLTAVELGVPRVISKAESPDHGRVLEKIGAEVINPEYDMALRLSKRLVTGTITDYISLGTENEISEIPLCPSLEGKTVIGANLRRKFGTNIIAIERGGSTMFNITADTEFERGDILVVIGRSADIRRLEEMK